MISKKQICGEAFCKVSVGSTRGQQRKRPVEKHESGTMLRLLMRPVTFFGRRVNAVQNEEPQNRAVSIGWSKKKAAMERGCHRSRWEHGIGAGTFGAGQYAPAG